MLIRAIFWFSLVVMFLPVESDQINSQAEDVSGGQTIMLFQSIASDVSGFCVRNPGSCQTARGLASQYGARVQAHAENLGEYLASNQEQNDPLTTGNVKPVQ